MSTLRDAMSHAALGWVKPELDETLRQVRNEVEAFVEDPSDSSRMRFCAGYLHQVQGTLRMVELYAPAMVAEELELLANAVRDGGVADRDEACATLMRGTVLLPDYLERLQNGHRDIPIVLLPLLNDIRAVRGAEGINESVLFAFNPDASDASPDELEHARGSVSGRNRELLDTVGSAVKEELMRIKDALDLHMRMDGNPADLQVQVNELGAVSDTLGVMGLGVARGIVAQQRDSLHEVVNGSRQIDDNLLLDIAGALLYVDASLDEQVAHLGANVAGEDDAGSVETRRTVEVLAHEAIANFTAARESFVAFIETNWDHARLAEVPRLLGEVSGALRMLEMPAPADYLQAVRQYIDVELIARQRIPSGRQLDTLADAMASLEYFLEALRDRRPGREEILDITRTSLETLRYWPIPSQQAVADSAVVETAVADLSAAAVADSAGIAVADSAAADMVETLAETVETAGEASPVVEQATIIAAAAVPPPLPPLEVEEKPQAAVTDYPLVFGAAINAVATPVAPVQVVDVPAVSASQGADGDAGSFAFDPVAAETPEAAASSFSLAPMVLEGQESADSNGAEAPASFAASFDPVAAEDATSTVASDSYHFDASLLTLDGTDTAAAQASEPASTGALDAELVNLEFADTDVFFSPELEAVDPVIDDATNAPVSLANDWELAATPVEQASAPIEPASMPAEAVSKLDMETAAFMAQLDAAAEAFDPFALPEPLQPEPVTAEVADSAASAAAPTRASAPAQQLEGGFIDGGDVIDQDIRDVFIEEFDEELENLGNLLPAWRAAPANMERLRPVRRVFHTLKGSGRLVGARTLGEFSWKIESMLNRVLDGSRPASPAVMAAVTHAYDVLPELNAALRGAGNIQSDLLGIQDVADRVAAGEEAFYVSGASAVATAAPAEQVAPEIAIGEPAESDLAAAIEIDDAEGTPASVDEVLREILEAEIGAHLVTVNAWLAGSAAQPQPVSEDLLRAVHTMSGAFAMTDVPVITQITSPAETFVKRSLAAAVTPTAAGVDALAQMAVAVQATITALRASSPRIPAFPGVAERLQALVDALPEGKWPPMQAEDDLVADDIAAVPSTGSLDSDVGSEPVGTEDLSAYFDAGLLDETPGSEASQDVPAPLAAAEPEFLQVGADVAEHDAHETADGADAVDAEPLSQPVDAAVESGSEAVVAVDEVSGQIDIAGSAEVVEPVAPQQAVDAEDHYDAVRASTWGAAHDAEETAEATDPQLAVEAGEVESESAVGTEVDLASAAEAVDTQVEDGQQNASVALEASSHPDDRDSVVARALAIATGAAAAGVGAAQLGSVESEAEAEAEAEASSPAGQAAETELAAADAEEIETAVAEEQADAAAKLDEVTNDSDVPSSIAAAQTDVVAPIGDEPVVDAALELEAVEAEAEAEAEAETAVEAEIEAETAVDDAALIEDIASNEDDASVEDALAIEEAEQLEEAAQLDDVAVSDVVEPVGVETIAVAKTVLAPLTAALPEQAEAPAAAAVAHELDAGPLNFADLDRELVDIFVEEGKDLLDHCDGLVNDMRAAPEDREALAGLQRDLHTLKGGARMAGINAIGDLGHAIESLLEAVAANRTEITRADVQLLERGFDRLHQLLIRTGEHRAVVMPTDLIEAFEARTDGRAEAAQAPVEAAASTFEPAPANAAAADVLPKPLAAIEPLSAPLREEQASNEEEGAPRGQEQVRVRADLLDSLVNHAGEVAIYRSRLEQQLGAFRGAMAELDRTNARLRDQLRRLDLETEAQIVARYRREHEQADQTFDPLELDRFSTLQQLSRALNESAADLGGLQGVLDDLSRNYDTLLQQQSRVSSELQDGLMRARMVPFDGLVPRLRRVVRQAAQETDKQVHLKLEGTHGELDRNVLDRMVAPLEHMLRNSVAHGLEQPAARTAAGKPEEGEIALRLRREGSEIVLEVGDDGAGLDREAIRRRAEQRGLLGSDEQIDDTQLDQMIFASGFSTSEQVSQLAGRGVGMDVVRNEVRQLGGSVDIHSVRGQGATFTLRLPQTLAVTQAVFVRIGETTYAVPVASVSGIGRISRERFESGQGGYHYNGEDFSLYNLGTLVGQVAAKAEGQAEIPLLLVRSGDLRAAVAIDQVLGNREVVVKPVGLQIASVPGIYGATITGEGNVVVILDVAPLVRRHLTQPQQLVEHTETSNQRHVPLVMVVDDSLTMRKVTGRVLERHNLDVAVARDGVEALEQLEERIPDLMLLDIEMPRMDGYELATAMRADPRYKNIPIVMITSRSGDKHRQRAFEIGVQRYLGKPYQELDLMRNVYDLLGIARARD
ncbi:Hpt domain-containing protein [Stenotrophomonas sp. PS02298]|uniref:Hpt domain-containing protein n=1 Tax=Stenotrophomonas sp. PS02298 TaxID=2991424 RepID=UPI00249B44AA|nr:Hpt domain-containing protein [Stenotrophomonas sp. PS02298]